MEFQAKKSRATETTESNQTWKTKWETPQSNRETAAIPRKTRAQTQKQGFPTTMRLLGASQAERKARWKPRLSAIRQTRWCSAEKAQTKTGLEKGPAQKQKRRVLQNQTSVFFHANFSFGREAPRKTRQGKRMQTRSIFQAKTTGRPAKQKWVQPKNCNQTKNGTKPFRKPPCRGKNRFRENGAVSSAKTGKKKAIKAIFWAQPAFCRIFSIFLHHPHNREIGTVCESAKEVSAKNRADSFFWNLRGFGIHGFRGPCFSGS